MRYGNLCILLGLSVGVISCVGGSGASTSGADTGIATKSGTPGALPSMVGGPFANNGITADRKSGYMAAVTSSYQQVKVNLEQQAGSWQQIGDLYTDDNGDRAVAVAIDESYVYAGTSGGNVWVNYTNPQQQANWSWFGAFPSGGLIYSLAIDDTTGTIYAATASGTIYECLAGTCSSPDGWSALPSVSSGSGKFFTTTLEAKDGNLYLTGYTRGTPVGQGGPVYVYSAGNYVKIFSSYNGVGATAAAVDESGNVYIGTGTGGGFTGGFVLECAKVGESYPTCTSLTEQSLSTSMGIFAVGVDESGGTVYAGDGYGIVHTYSDGSWSTVALDGAVNFMTVDESGNAYAGTVPGSAWINLISGGGWTNISPSQ